mmetsp:Transcript_45108/g.84187  ORF Transcript_45108/g.84187 Transcript_45108/m.84187 type:complete len:185 (+) Transcript_45108:77-631(+)
MTFFPQFEDLADVPAPVFVLPTAGTLGHPEACRRACLDFIAGQCKLDGSCPYCHLPHEGAPAKLHKKHRSRLQGLLQSELCALVLPICRLKVDRAGLADAAVDLIKLLEEHAAASERRLEDILPMSDIAQLRKALGKLKLSNLIGLVTRQESMKPDGQDALFVALENFRMDLLKDLLTPVLISM